MSSAKALASMGTGEPLAPLPSGMGMPRMPSGLRESVFMSEIKPCMQSRYRHGESGQPCARPFDGDMCSRSVTPLILKRSWTSLYMVRMMRSNDGGNCMVRMTSNRYSHRTRGYALSWSAKTMKPGVPVASQYRMTSCVRRVASPISSSGLKAF